MSGGQHTVDVDIVVPNGGEPFSVDHLVVDTGVIGSVAETEGVVGEGRQRLAIPALSNAHDHGRPFSPTHHGVRDDQLELWVAGLVALPTLNPYLTAVAALCQLARGGVSSVVHLHEPGPNLAAEAALVMQAAQDVGMRMGFVVPIMDRRHTIYGKPSDLLARVPPEWRSQIDETWGASPPSLASQLDTVRTLAELAPPHVDVQLGPTAPQWCSNEALAAVAEMSADHDIRVHMHLLETRRQREWADASFQEGLIRYLDHIGLLSPRLTVAHGVWLRPRELDLLALRGVALVANTSSNLRLQSGVAPLAAARAAGVPVALGLDSLPLLTPGDMLEEWRLGHLIHKMRGDAELDRFVLEGLTGVGHVLAGRDGRSDLVAQSPADIVMTTWDVSSDGQLSSNRVWDAMRQQGSERIDALYVAGRQIMQAGVVTTVDEAAVLDELNESVRRFERDAHGRYELEDVYRTAIRRFYLDDRHLVAART